MGADAGAGWDRDALVRRFRAFAEREAGASPLYRALAAAVAGDAALLDLAAHARAKQPPANMLFAAVQGLLLRGHGGDPLAAFYPGLTARARSLAGAPPVFRRFCLAHAGQIRELLQTRAVSTNEPARAALLRPAFALAMAELPGPVHFVEVGASAGLVLLWPHAAVETGGDRRFGPASPELIYPLAVEGDPPLDLDAGRVASLQGIEREALDATDPADATWLRALIWPEQTHRAARLDAALAVARRHPPMVHQGDALDLLPRLAAELPPGEALVVHHQFTLNQFAEEARERLFAQLSEIARTRPVRRVALEWSGRDRAAILELAEPDAGPRRLARCDPHGAWLAWEA